MSRLVAAGEGLDARICLSRGEVEVDVALTAEPGQVIGHPSGNVGNSTEETRPPAGVGKP